MGVDVVLIVLVIGFVLALFAIEAYTVVKGIPTISERLQRLNAAMGTQLVAGIFFLLGAIAGWLVAHFASTPPGG